MHPLRSGVRGDTCRAGSRAGAACPPSQAGFYPARRQLPRQANVTVRAEPKANGVATGGLAVAVRLDARRLDGPLCVEVQLELVRMRAQAHGVDLVLALVADLR